MTQWQHGMIIGNEGGGTVRFHYNPHTVKISKNPQWHGIGAAGREQELMQYACGAPINYEIEVDLTRAGGDSYVKDTIDQLVNMCKPTKKNAGVDRPPKVQIILGGALNAECVITEVSGTYGPLFAPMGLNPYLGKVTVKFAEVKES